MSTPLFHNPEAASKVCLVGGILNPPVFYVATVAAAHFHGFILMAFAPIIVIQILAQIFFIVSGLASLLNLPKENKGSVISRSISGIIIGIVLGCLMFYPLAGMFLAQSHGC